MNGDAISSLFGQRLRLARLRAELSQAGLAQRLGVGQDTISHYEKGQSQPNIITTYQLAQILAVDVNYFFPVQSHPTDAEALALLPSLSCVSYTYVLQFIHQAARVQQQQRFFQAELQRDEQACLQQALEREIQVLETLKLRRGSQAVLEGLAHFSLILTYLAQLERDAVAEEVLKRVWQQGRRMIYFLWESAEVSYA